MPKKDVHLPLHSVTIRTANGLEFTTMTTRDNKGKLLHSDFDEASLPWNKVGLGSVTAKDASVQKYRSRQGSALGFASVLSGGSK